MNHKTGKVNTYYLDPKTGLKDLLDDAIDLDLARAFTDGQRRSLVITANPPTQVH